jgi:hypothetical protein
MEDPAPQPVHIHSSLESNEATLKQWEAINTICHGICANLERVDSLVKELPANYADAIGAMLRPPPAKLSPLTKVAAGFSFAAAILSVLSLSLSQSARQAILSRDFVRGASDLGHTASAPARPAHPITRPQAIQAPVVPIAPAAVATAPAAPIVPLWKATPPPVRPRTSFTATLSRPANPPSLARAAGNPASHPSPRRGATPAARTR